MKTLVIITAQTYENYGAHNWNGQGDCPQAWKPKGSQTFTLRVNSDAFLYMADECVKAIHSLLAEQSNNFERFTYIEHELVFHEPIALSDEKFEVFLQAEAEKAFN